MEEREGISKINIVMIAMLVLCLLVGILAIVLSMSKTEINLIGKSANEIEKNYTTTEDTSNTWDVSEKGDGSLTATLSDDGTLTIYGIGEMKDYSYGTSPWYSVKGQIKSVIIKSGVTSIGAFAFYSCTSLTNIEISDSVMSLGEESKEFYICTSLIDIKVDSDNTVYCDIDGVLYTKDRTKIIRYPEGKKEMTYTILSGVTSIGSSAFSDCKNLRSIEIPNSVTNIGKFAFYGCAGLVNLEIPDSIKSISDSNVFYNCKITNLINREENEIELPDTLKRTQNETDILYSSKEFSFKNCTIEYNKIKINKDATYCTIEVKDGKLSGLTYIISYNKWEGLSTGNGDVMATLDSDEVLTISGTGNMKDFSTYSAVPWYPVREHIKRVKIEEGVTGFGKYAFLQCESLTKIKIPRSVIQIRNDAFYSSDQITILCYKDTYAEIYSKENNIKYEIIELSKIEVTKIPNKTSYIEGQNFDKTGMEVTATYNDGNTKKITNYTVTDGNNLTVGKANVTISYTEDGVTQTTTQPITVIPKLEINLGIYVENQQGETTYIKNIQPSTTMQQFLQNIKTNGNVEIYKGTERITDTAKRIATGMKLKISLSNQKKEYTIVVIGDSSGDGETNIRDILEINKHRLNKSNLVGEYLEASDVNKDGKVNIRDILEINKFRLGKVNEL